MYNFISINLALVLSLIAINANASEVGKQVSRVSPIATTVVSTVNNLKVKLPGEKLGYRFIVGGHLYGSAHISESEYPASSLIGGIDILTSKEASFFVSTGDNYRTPSKHEMSLFRKSFIDRVKLPVFIAPGNHDGANSGLYRKEFGANYSSFRIRSELYIFLNTEFPNGDIVGDQKNFLMATLENAQSDQGVKNIFIFSHKLIWAARRPSYQFIISNVNAKKQYENSKFSTQILPKLKQVAKSKNIYWGSGDIGNPPSFGLFFQRDDTDGITYFAAGLGDVRNDSVLLVHVSNEGNVSFEGVSLANKTLRPINEYNLDFWRTRYEFFTTLERKVRRVLAHTYFTYGVYVGSAGAGGLGILILLTFWLRSRRRP